MPIEPAKQLYKGTDEGGSSSCKKKNFCQVLRGDKTPQKKKEKGPNARLWDIDRSGKGRGTFVRRPNSAMGRNPPPMGESSLGSSWPRQVTADNPKCERKRRMVPHDVRFSHNNGGQERPVEAGSATTNCSTTESSQSGRTRRRSSRENSWARGANAFQTFT